MDVLCHYGVKGQKWGVRRGPPYPLNSDRISSIKTKVSAIESEVKKYASGGPSGNQNCQLCTWALESQFRGQNVLPRPIYSPRDIAFELNGYDIVKNPVKVSINNKEDVVKILKDAGDGGRFYTHVNWKGSTSGHEFITINIGNKIYVSDGQAGIISELGSKSAKSYFDDINYKNSYLVRMDDKELNTDILKYNKKKYITKWNWDEDISFMKKNGMISESEAEEALRLKHSFDSHSSHDKESLSLWDRRAANRCYKIYRFVQFFLGNQNKMR